MSTHKIRAVIAHYFWVSGCEDKESAYPELEITYSYTPGCPETGPTYDCGGVPASPAVMEVISVRIIDDDGLMLGPDQAREIAERWLEDAGYDDALENIPDGPDPDDTRDAEIDRRLCENRP